MSTWNVPLGRRPLNIIVKEVLQKDAGSMVITDDREGRQHKLSKVDFPSDDWERICSGTRIALTISEAVTSWRVQPAPIKERVKRLIDEAQKKCSGYFYMWFCEHCHPAGGIVEYEDGDDPQRIMERILTAHKKEMKPGCRGDISIFDHRGERHMIAERLLSSHKVKG